MFVTLGFRRLRQEDYELEVSLNCNIVSENQSPTLTTWTRSLSSSHLGQLPQKQFQEMYNLLFPWKPDDGNPCGLLPLPPYRANGFVATEIRVRAYCSKNFVTCSNLNPTCIALVFAQDKRVWKRKMRSLWILSPFIDFLRGCCTESLIHEDLGGQRYNFICQTRLQFCFRQQSLYFKGFQKRSICKV